MLVTAWLVTITRIHLTYVFNAIHYVRLALHLAIIHANHVLQGQELLHRPYLILVTAWLDSSTRTLPTIACNAIHYAHHAQLQSIHHASLAHLLLAFQPFPLKGYVTA